MLLEVPTFIKRCEEKKKNEKKKTMKSSKLIESLTVHKGRIEVKRKNTIYNMSEMNISPVVLYIAFCTFYEPL